MVEFVGMGEVPAGTPAPRHNASKSSEGLVPMLYYGAAPLASFSLKIKALRTVRLSDVLQVGSALTPAAAWNEAEEQLEVALEFEAAQSAQAPTTDLLGCQPNPFERQATIRFNLPTAGEARFVFHDASGKKLLVKTGHYEAGEHRFVVRSEELGATGLVFLTMEAGGVSQQLKLAVMD
jgi:hypothetical protein